MISDAPRLAFDVVLVVMLVAIALIDLRHLRIPDQLNGSLFALGIVGTQILDLRTLSDALLASVACGTALWLIRGIYRRLRGRDGLGLGDVKFVAAAAPWVGIEGIPTMLLYASLSAIIVNVSYFYIANPPADISKIRIAFGPFLAFGLGTTWIFGPFAV